MTTLLTVKASASILAAASCLLAGCANLAPDYLRPAAPLPATWPAEAATASMPAANIAWREFFIDERLLALVARALADNRDLRIAALDIEQAQALYRLQRAVELPPVDATAGASRQRSRSEAGPRTTSQFSVELGLAAYEIDLFGRLRNLSDSALQSYLAIEETRRSAQISLVSELANAWLTMAADQQRLALAQETLRTRRTTLDLVQRSRDLGGASGLTLNQAQAEAEAARGDVAAYTAQVRQDRNALDLLAGASVPTGLLPVAPVPVQAAASGASATAAPPTPPAPAPVAVLVAVPEGLPSTLLTQRPDVLAAERLLQGSHADIGAARAAFFPRISLTAAAGLASGSLNELFDSDSRAWSFAPSLTLPIFDGGANRANLRVAEVEQRIRLASYEKTLQTAFREVADALALRSTLGERLAAQDAQAQATGRSLALSQARFRNGADSYLEVLDAQRSLYGAQQDLITLQLAEQVNRVQLYRALGGGWQPADGGP